MVSILAFYSVDLSSRILKPTVFSVKFGFKKAKVKSPLKKFDQRKQKRLGPPSSPAMVG